MVTKRTKKEANFSLSPVFTLAIKAVRTMGDAIVARLEQGKDLIMYYQALYCREKVGDAFPATQDGRFPDDSPAIAVQKAFAVGTQHTQRLWYLGDTILRTKADYTAFVQDGNFSDVHRIASKVHKEVKAGDIVDGTDIVNRLDTYRQETGKTSSKGKGRTKKGEVNLKVLWANLARVLGADAMGAMVDVLHLTGEFANDPELALNVLGEHFKDIAQNQKAGTATARKAGKTAK